MGLFCVFHFYNLSCELTVAQHVKRLREQSEALGGARVAAAARVMLQRETPVADTKIKRPQNDNKPYRFLLLMKSIYITLLRSQTNSNLRLLYISSSGIAIYFQNSVIVSSHGLFISLNLYTLTVLMHKCKPEFLK